MLKISQANQPNRVTVSLDGVLRGPWVDELRRVCDAVLAQKQTLELDTERLAYLDAAGRSLLLDLRSRQVVLSNTSQLVEELLRGGVA